MLTAYFSDIIKQTTDNMADIDSPFITLPYMILSFDQLKLNKTLLSPLTILLHSIMLIKASYCSFKLHQLTPSLLQELI